VIPFENSAGFPVFILCVQSGFGQKGIDKPSRHAYDEYDQGLG
jgi:crotonobetainyl-CoA:carnitine CoA-transferase CaiB-like acyl-CoA transferase